MNAPSDVLTEAAFAIYQTWSRERDPYRARQRFDRLPATTRDQFIAEARAAQRVFDAHHRMEFA